MPKNNKIYWLEGVTEKGVKQLLNDDNPKFAWLRLQRNRRALVVVMSFGLLTTALGSYYPSLKNAFGLSSDADLLVFSLAAIFVIISVLAGYLFLRVAVRGIADAPTELLDERQLHLRDSSFRTAYVLSGYLIISLILLSLFAPDLTMFSETADDGSYLAIATLFTYASLPSMVLAWREGDI